MYNKFWDFGPYSKQAHFSFVAEIIDPDLKDDQEAKRKFLENFGVYLKIAGSFSSEATELIDLANELPVFFL